MFESIALIKSYIVAILISAGFLVPQMATTTLPIDTQAIATTSSETDNEFGITIPEWSGEYDVCDGGMDDVDKCLDSWIIQLPSGELTTQEDLDARASEVIIDVSPIETKVEPVMNYPVTAVPMEKLYTITAPSDSPLQSRSDITLEEMRAYVIKSQYGVVSFLKQMTKASEQELINYLRLNGFEVTTN